MELVSRRDEFQLKIFFQLRIIRGNQWQSSVANWGGRGKFEVQLVSPRDEFQLELVSPTDEEAIP